MTEKITKLIKIEKTAKIVNLLSGIAHIEAELIFFYVDNCLRKRLWDLGI